MLHFCDIIQEPFRIRIQPHFSISQTSENPKKEKKYKREKGGEREKAEGERTVGWGTRQTARTFFDLSFLSILYSLFSFLFLVFSFLRTTKNAGTQKKGTNRKNNFIWYLLIWYFYLFGYFIVGFFAELK